MQRLKNTQHQPRRGRPLKLGGQTGKGRPSRSRIQTRQLELLPGSTESATVEFGGSLLGKSSSSHAKIMRPLKTRRPIHLVLKSRVAMGARSMLAPANASAIRRLLNRLAKRYGVRVYRYANGGNHLHLLLTIHDRTMFAHFLRAASGLIARYVLRKERGRAHEHQDRAAGTAGVSTKRTERKPSFWNQRPYTRIATWGREWRNLVNYFRLNNLEAIGFFKHQPRGLGSTQSRQSFYSIDVV